MTKLSLKIILFTTTILLIRCSDEESEIIDLNVVELNLEVNEEIPIEDRINVQLVEKHNGITNTYPGTIHRRGGFSISFPKQSYEIDLQEDISLAGLPDDDDWILNANYIDKTFLRHVFSYELFASMDTKNIRSKSAFVEVLINNAYNGLYVLMEKLDKSSLNIDASDSTAVIWKEPHIFRETYDGISPQKEDNFHQQTYPKIAILDKSSVIDEIRNSILTTDDLTFTNDIVQLFDIDNIIDWHLLLLISNNSDGILKGFYLYKINQDTPF